MVVRQHKLFLVGGARSPVERMRPWSHPLSPRSHRAERGDSSFAPSRPFGPGSLCSLSWLIGFVLTTASLLGGAACVSGELDEVSTATVGTHVQDWRDEIIYQVVVDRFANGSARNDYRVNAAAASRYHGGDWQGILDRLDYIEALGVTALWISPIVRNVETDAGVDGYHGYWAVDLTHLNPHFGDLATLRTLIDACHGRGIKVILDIVTNHLGQVFYYDINMNGQPDEQVYGSGGRSPVSHVTEYDPDYDPRGIQASTSLGEAGPSPIRFFDMPEIFRVPPTPAIFRERSAYNLRGRVTDWNDREQVLYGDFPGGLKDVNTENPAVREAMIAAYVDWVLELDLDGFRIDTLKHVEHAFWSVFAGEVRRRLSTAGKNNFLMFGEAFDGDDALVGSFTAPGLLDSVFYFPQKFQVFDDVFARGGPTTKIEDLFVQRATHYGSAPHDGGIGVPPRDSLVNFLDNHDVPRFLFQRPDAQGPAALRAALAYLLTEDGIPCIYYGTEQDFRGGNDPANREDLWLSSYRTDGDTFSWVARLARLRRSYPALRRGDFVLRWTTDRVGDEQDAGIVAFERSTAEGDYALIVINTQGRHASETSASTAGGSDMVISRSAGTVLVELVSGSNHTVAPLGTLRLRVEPYGIAILIPPDQVRP